MRPWFPLLCVSLLTALACESSPKGTSAPRQKGAPAESSLQPVPAKTIATSGLIDVTTAPMRVANLVGNEALNLMHPSEYCLEDGNLYAGAPFRLGRVNVFGLDAELAALGSSGLVAVVGETKLGLDKKLQGRGPCPDGYEPMHVQMRSDWMAPEGGPITTRAKLAALPYQEGQRAMRVEMAEVLESNETLVRVRIRNPFSLPLAGLRFVAHYEGGRGKPMPTGVEQSLALQPGEATDIELPRELGETSVASKAGSGLHSLRLQGALGRADLDIEIFLPHR